MEESKENLNERNRNRDGNFFGWKWSLVSLIIILTGLVTLIIVKPEHQRNIDSEREAPNVEVIDSINK